MRSVFARRAVAAAALAPLLALAAPALAHADTVTPSPSPSPSATAPAVTEGEAAVKDGDSPYTDNCAAGATTAKSADITVGGAKVGLIEIRHSANCDVAWGRIQLTDAGEQYVNEQTTVAITREGSDATYSCTPSLDKSDSLNAYTCYTSVVLLDGGSARASAVNPAFDASPGAGAGEVVTESFAE
ncbi:DUF2690 domain-containing protein [Streptomyces sp. NPDC020898]|uniref:DUF2690 domain-containing protein n=1 Tax=Streptomyces sp. NPDC020898 TaxID=3365101 RepID=UPI003795B2A9